MTPTLLVLTGPTASGKSGLAMKLARTFNAEIVSADSAQVYRGLDIGTAKPSKADQEAVPHHLIDLVDPDESYDAGRFVQDAQNAIQAIQQRGRLPIVVGGTGMYIRALLYGLVDLPPSDAAMREVLRDELERQGPEAMYHHLCDIDPLYAAKIHQNDHVRVLRAIEVFRLSGTPLGEHHRIHAVKARQPPKHAVQVALMPNRQALYARINTRVAAMIEAGWLDEVRALLDNPAVPRDARGFGVMGYKHLVRWIETGATPAHLDEALDLVRRDHRRYAKRQTTWLRGQLHLNTFATPNEAHAHILSLRDQLQPNTQANPPVS